VNGIVLDVNMSGYLLLFPRMFEALGLFEVWASYSIELLRVADLGLPDEASDRLVWNLCRSRNLILLTDNRNNDGPDSLEATLAEQTEFDFLPVLTIANKQKFHRERSYALTASSSLLDVLADIARGEYRGSGRLYIPKKPGH